MRRFAALAVLLAAGVWWLQAEVIDRIAVTVDNIVITASDVSEHIRIAALLDGTPPDFSPPARRAAARRLVEQTLIVREMEVSRYPLPEASDVGLLRDEIRRQGVGTEEELRAKLKEYRVGEEELWQNLQRQLTMLRFIEYRFRPEVAPSDTEVEEYYSERFLPEWRQRNQGQAPPLEDVRDDIEEIVTQQRIDRALEQWLRQASTQARIEYREEAFQ